MKNYWREIWPLWATTAFVLAALAILVLNVGSSHGLGNYWAFVHHPSTTGGTVLKVRETPPCLAQYEVEAGATKTKGYSTNCDLKPNQPLQIYFNIAEPELNSATPPWNGFLVLVALVVMAILVVSGALSAFIWQNRRAVK